MILFDDEIGNLSTPQRTDHSWLWSAKGLTSSLSLVVIPRGAVPPRRSE
jgi:hypothetical protein